MSEEHWIKRVKREHTVMRGMLANILALTKRTIHSRERKEMVYPSTGEYGMGYRACLKEISLRIEENERIFREMLEEQGIILGNY